MTETRKELFKLIVRYGLLFVIAAALFLLMALTVFALRTESAGVWTMPNVSGSYYSDVHNELSRMNLRVEIDREYFPDRPQGIVLTQSVLPGEVVRGRDKLVLTVNSYKAILEIADFKGTPLTAALSSIKQMVHEDQVFSLQPGIVSYVYDESVADGTVIDQFPPANARVMPDSTIDFLVSSRKDEVKRAFMNRSSMNVEQLKNVRIDVISSLFMKAGVDYQIVKINETNDEDKSGRVSNIEFKNNQYELTVEYRKPSTRFFEGFESISKDIGPSQNCEAALISEGDKRLVWKSSAMVEELKLVFFRVGERQLEVRCGGEVVYKKNLRPEIQG